MIGITSFGAYVPATRLPLALLGGRPAVEGGPEKAVAWNDEDSVTLGVQAARECLRGLDAARVDAVFFASTTPPFQEKQCAALVARALHLRREVRGADHAGSLRAGLGALRAAFDAVAAGSARSVLVIASDCRMAAPGSPLEANLGDAAAAFLVEDGDAIATLSAAHAVADEIVDVWRSPGDDFVHSWEDRFVVQEGYTPRLVEAVAGLLEREGFAVDDCDRVVLPGPDARSQAGVLRRLRVPGEAAVDPLFGRLGHSGTAAAPLLLASALEGASPGQRILLGAYGDGAEALLLETTVHLEKLAPRRGVAWHLARRRPVARYEHYLKARNLGTSEWQAGSGPGLSATIHFRDRDEDLGFLGQRCRNCGAIQFPAQRVCETCFAKDDFEKIRLADGVGHVVTYTFDFFFPTPNPPTVVTITEIDGARVHLQLTGLSPEEVRIGLPVEFVFRRIHQAGGRPNYYWKGTPVLSDS